MLPKVTTWRNRTTGKETNRITMRREDHLCLTEMIDGLCSKYVRNRCDDDAPLPDTLSGRAVMESVKEQYDMYGTNATWTWSDDLSSEDAQKYSDWARALILAVWPEMGENE